MASSRKMMAAVVLGTAFSAGSSQAATQTTDQAVKDISRYCQACWRNARLPADHWPDCTQQVFVRLLERIDQNRLGAALDKNGNEHKEFLRAVDAVKKRIQRVRMPGILPETLSDRTTDKKDEYRENRQWIIDQTKLLSERQKLIIELSFIGYGVNEIAEKLATSVDRVSDEKYKAIRKLQKSLADHGLS